MRRALYDLMYRIGAPWDGPPRPELVALIERGVLTPARLAPHRALGGLSPSVVVKQRPW
jgi:hypothetical protein